MTLLKNLKPDITSILPRHSERRKLSPCYFLTNLIERLFLRLWVCVINQHVLCVYSSKKQTKLRFKIGKIRFLWICFWNLRTLWWDFDAHIALLSIKKNEREFVDGFYGNVYQSCISVKKENDFILDAKEEILKKISKCRFRALIKLCFERDAQYCLYFTLYCMSLQDCWI